MQRSCQRTPIACSVTYSFWCRHGGWVSATEGDGAEEQDEEMVEAQPSTAPKEEEEEQSMIREAAIGKGRLLL